VKKTHPSMIPFGELTKDGQKWNLADAEQVLKVIACLGYEVVPIYISYSDMKSNYPALSQTEPKTSAKPFNCN
jgi:hypothetical protein